MRILAIETSGRDASLALLQGGDGESARLVKQEVVAGRERTAQVLAPRLRDLLPEVGWPIASIRLVTVAVGPGSFTGLRIGVTTAKTLAYALGADVIGVNTLAVVAEHAPPTAALLWAVMDAQRQELFAAKFNRQRQLVHETHVVSQAEWLGSLQSGDYVTGPGLRRLVSALPAGVHVVEESRWMPTAGALGQIAWRDYLSGRRDDVWKLAPQYYRQSAAEEKRDSQKI